MSEFLGSAILELRANAAPLRAGMMEAERFSQASVARMQGNMAKGMVGVGASMSNAGRRMTSMVTVPILGVAAASAKMSMDFQSAMTMIETQAGAPRGEIQKLHDAVLSLSGKVAQSPKVLADGLFHLESIGLRGKNALNALHVAADGAAVGHANLEQTATALGSAWLVGIKGADGASGSMKNLNSTMGILNATVGIGNMRMQDLVTSLGTGILPSAKRAGLALQDVMGALAVFSDEGYKAYSAATQMATAFHYLTDPTKKATDALGTIGLKQFDLSADMHKPNGLFVALSDLKKHLDATYPANNGRPLTIDQERQALDKYRASLESGGVSGKKLEKAMEAYKRKLKELGTSAVAQEAVLGDIFPAGRGRVLGVLMNQLDRYHQKLGQLAVGEHKWGGDIAQTHQTAAFKAKAAWDGLQADLIKFGDHVLPTFVKVGSDILHAVQGVFHGFERLPKGMQDAILKGGLILAGIGPAMRVLGFFGTQIGRLTSLATVAGRLAMGQGWRQATTGTRMDRAGALSSTVTTMTVGEMVVKSMIGGGPGGVGGSRGRGGTGPIPPMPTGGPGGPRGYVGPYSGTGYTTWGPYYGTRQGRTAGGQFGPALPAMSNAEQQRLRQYIFAQQTGYAGTSSTAGSNAYLRNIGRMTPAQAFAAQYGSLPGARFAPPVPLGTPAPPVGRFAGAGAALSRVGGIAMQGLGMVGIAAMAVPIALAVGKGLQALFSEPSFGQSIAGHFTKGFGGGNRATLQKQVASALDELNKLTTTNRVGARGVMIPVHLDVSQLSPAKQKRALELAQQAGTLVAKQLVAGWNQYRFQNEPMMFQQFRAETRKLPKEAQYAAAETALRFSQKLVSEGRLSKQAGADFLRHITQQLPGFARYMGLQAGDGIKQFTRALNFKNAEHQVKVQLDKLRSHFPEVTKAMDDTAGNVQDKAAAMIKALEKLARGTGSSAAQARKDIRSIRNAAKADLTAAADLADSQFARMGRDMKRHGHAAATNVATNFGAIQQKIQNAIASGTISAVDGTALIAQTLDKALKAFGVKSNAGVVALTKASIGANTLNVTGKINSFLGLGHAAQGALLQVGQPGQAGTDTIPMNVGGMPIMVGAGEQVAVFNRHQQAFMDQALAPIGGLQGMFERVNQPHYAAKGGMIPRKFAKGGSATGGFTVTASEFGGHNDPSAFNHSTASGAIANDSLWGYAELSHPGTLDFSALGHLPMGTQLNITLGGKTARAPKVDVGRGGAGLNGHLRAIDLTYAVARALGMGGLADVQIGGAPGLMVTGGAGGGAGGVAAAWKAINAPKVHGGGAMGDIVQGALNKVTDAANKYGQAHMPVVSSTGIGGGPSPMAGPQAVQAMIAEANLIDSKHYPYVFGGGHGSFNGPYDCSGAVSAVLHAAGLMSAPEATGALASYGSPGPGKLVSIYVENSSAGGGHTIMSINGRLFGTTNGRGGNWLAGNNPVAYSPIGHWETTRHPTGLARGGMIDSHTGKKRHSNKKAAWAHAPDHFVDEIVRNIGNHGVSQPGLARGGMVRRFARGGIARGFAGGGLTTTYPHTPRKPVLPKKGGSTSGKGTSGTKTTKGKGTKVVKAKPHRPPRFPTIKGIPGFDPEQNALATQVSQLGDWQSFIDGLHGRDSVAPTVTITDASGNSVEQVNWGDPKATLAQTLMRPTGAIDDTTGLPTLSIWDRIREIGHTSDPVMTDPMTDTELGIQQALLDLYIQEQGVAGNVLAQAKIRQPRDTARSAWFDRALDPLLGWRKLGKMDFRDLGSFTTMKLQRKAWGWIKGRHGKRGHWRNPALYVPVKNYYQKLIWDKVKEYKNYQARIERLTKQREQLPLERQKREHAIEQRMALAKHMIRIGRIKSGAQLYSHLVEGELGLSKEERTRKASLKHMPASWKGDAGAWGDQRKLEESSISNEYASRRAALQKATQDARVAGALNAANADFAVTSQASNDKFAVKQHYGELANNIRDELRRDHLIVGQDKKDIGGYKKTVTGDLAAENDAIAKLGPFLGPMGQLRIGINTKQLIDIPNLNREIATLMHTHLPKGTGSGSGDAAASQLATLLQQQLAQAGQALAISQAQYKVLSNLQGLPPFGGSFREGGVVPGPLGAARMILAHGGEVVTPPGAAPSVETHVHMEKLGDLNQLIDTRIETRTRQAARSAGRMLPSRGGGNLIGV